jgi:hypothetical protein
MPKPAGTNDIESRWRPLTSAEEVIADTRLDDAWRMLRRFVPDVEARMVNDVDLTDDVVQILADSVIRILQFNAASSTGQRKGAVTIDDGSRSWELDSAIQGGLYFTDTELESVAASGESFRGRAYSVIPS